MNDWDYGYRSAAQRHSDTLIRAKRDINSRIRQVEQELNETFRLIGQALVRGNDTAEFVVNAKVTEARLTELKNALALIG